MVDYHDKEKVEYSHNAIACLAKKDQLVRAKEPGLVVATFKRVIWKSRQVLDVLVENVSSREKAGDVSCAICLFQN